MSIPRKIFKIRYWIFVIYDLCITIYFIILVRLIRLSNQPYNFPKIVWDFSRFPAFEKFHVHIFLQLFAFPAFERLLVCYIY